jgi:predicted deacylase
MRDEDPVHVVTSLPDLRTLPLGTRHRFGIRVGSGLGDEELTVRVNVIVGSEPGRRLAAVAGVHGDEQDGPAALIQAWRDLDPAELSGILVSVPVANPPAFRAASRLALDDGVDMNRSFPGDPTGSTTERLASCVFEEVVKGSDMVLSMHSFGRRSIVTPYVEFHRIGAVAGASSAAAVAFGLGIVEPLEWHPGLLGAAAGRIGIPAIEPEIGGAGVALEAATLLYLSGLRNLLRHLGILPGAAPATAATFVERDVLLAPCAGFVCHALSLGEPAVAGDVVARITDLHGVTVAEMTAPRDGFVAAQRVSPMVEPGSQVGLIFHEIHRKPWATSDGTPT